MFMLSLEVVGPGGNLSTLLIPRPIGGTLVGEYPGKCQRRGRIQLPMDDGGACLLARGQLAVVMVERFWSSMAMDS
jgi:hypothetical protein